MPTESTYSGQRMTDVRQSIARDHGGMKSADKHNAGLYTITAVDGSTWTVAGNNRTGWSAHEKKSKVLHEKLPDGTPVNVTVTDSRKGK